MLRTALLLAAVLLILAPAHVMAQIVNVLPKNAQQDEDGLGGELSGSVTWRCGNARYVKGNAWLGVKLATQTACDSRPPRDVEKVDSSIESSVVVTF